jgi:elongation factor P
MKITAIEIKPGNILDHQNRLWVVLKRELIQPGKGGAFAQVEMRTSVGQRRFGAVGAWTRRNTSSSSPRATR